MPHSPQASRVSLHQENAVAWKNGTVDVVDETPHRSNRKLDSPNDAASTNSMESGAGCLVSSKALSQWKEAVQAIPERCDLSGLSREPMKYQLASTGIGETVLAMEQRAITISDELIQAVRNNGAERQLSSESIVLFAVHQMLKGFGNGSHTVTASFTSQSPKHSATPSWTVFPTVANHNNREGQSVDQAIGATNDFLDTEEQIDEAIIDTNDLVKSEFIDLVVVFDDVANEAPIPNFPLILQVSLKETQWRLTMEYASNLFNSMVVDSFLSALRTLLSVVTEPTRLVGDIELLPSEQIAQMDQWNNTDGDYPREKRLHHLFEDAAARCESQVAIIFGEKHVTYKELNEQANSLAHYLCSEGIQPEQFVGLFLDKSETMIATIIGIWKSGAASVPIDPLYPDDRVKFVLDDTQVRIIIASQRHVHRLRNEIAGDREIRIIQLEPLMELLAEQRSAKTTRNLVHLQLTSKQLAYVTYTSGTTGFPKGIYKEHTSVVNSITDLSSRYGVAGQDDEVIMLFSAYVFEPFVRQMLMALTTGNRLAIISDEEKLDPNTLLPFIQKHRVSYLNGTASVLQEYDFTTCPSLKRMILVGENLTDARYTALRRRFKNRIFNEYGFTESAFVTALNIFEPTSERKDMSLGRPVRNVKCYILDSNLKRVPLGVTGELHIGGLGISRGYMNREKLTKEKFLHNPYQTEGEKARGVNGLMYKTGDLARWLPSGQVEYLGRADFQIKLRGIRIEPGEIESTLAMYPGVRTSIVVSKKLLSSGQETTQDHLVGYFVCDENKLSENDLLAFLETKLPRYMIPTRLVQLPQIPVTINGKADLRALPTVEVAVSSSSSGSAERRDEMDTTLAKIWGDVLGVSAQSIGLEHNFFRLGGHSITCIQLIARVRQQLGRGIGLEEVFQTRTLQAMADLLRGREQDSQPRVDGDAEVGDCLSSNEAANNHAEANYLANSLQQGFVYHSLKTQQSDAYVMQSMLYYETALHEDVYRSAWETVQKQHPALRLRFSWEAEVLQLVDSQSNLDWRTLDWSDTKDEAEQKRLFEQIQQKDCTETYNLNVSSLIRLSFIKLSENRYWCLFSCHHSILDGWSLPLLFEYVHEAYLDLSQGENLPIKENLAYLHSQRYLQNHRDDHLDFWAKQIDMIEERCDMNALLNEASRYKVPLANYDQIQEQRQQTIHLPWDDSMTNLREECSSKGITLHSMLQLVWHLVLHSYGGGSHTVTGTTISGRNLPVAGIERALGLFINTLPLVIDHNLYQKKTAIEAIELVQSQVNAMNSRGNVELGRLSKDDLKHGLFDTLFVLENYPNLDTSKRSMQQEKLKYTIEGGIEKLSYPLAVIAKEHGDDGCSFTLCYASELFTDDTIKVLLQTVRDTFQNIARNMNAPICDIEYLSTEHVRLLDQWNDTQNEFPGGTLHAVFESEAQQKPDKTAVVYENRRLTYRELNSRANALAYHLLSKVSIRPNDLVALVLDKSEHMITDILAVWKTGGAYVPIDPGYPDDRIKYILEDTRALAVIVDEKYLERLRELTEDSLLLIPSDLATKLPPSHVHPVSSCSPTDLAYTMYTSGTTGRPKGVMVEHHGVVNLAASMADIFGLRKTDNEVILSFSNYVFDHFVEQMTDALLNGQTLLILNDEMRGDKERLYRYIETNRVTYLSGTPSVISTYEFSRFQDHLRRIDCVGEAFSEPVFDKIRETFPGLVINGYGPTEVSITTHKRLYPFPERRTDKSIGCQVANSTSYVLNDEMKRVPIGAVGELYLGGDGVARGYHNRPDLTAERFPVNPFQNEQEKREGRNSRLYKTGDLVRWIQTPDGRGEIEYLGRNDFQVKIRGQRIELGEIEAVLSSYPEIVKSVVLAKDRPSDGQKYLVGYYVSPGSLSPKAIRRFMQTRLPEYMVPSRLVPIAKFPVTVSGKLDTKALPIPEETVDDDVVPPRTEVERILTGIWAKLLEIPAESISIYSDFFSLGGDSLRSTKLSFAASQALGVTVSVSSLFRHPTIEALAHWIVGGSVDLQEIPPLQGGALVDIPVSPAQERLLFIHEFDGGSDAYNIAMQVKFDSAVCLKALEQAFRDVLSRHEALRTLMSRCHENSRHCQRILDADSAQKLFSFDVLQVASEVELHKLMRTSTQHVFSLDAELPLQVNLYQLSGEDVSCYASLVFHHSAFDAWSWDVFQRDLEAYYAVYVGQQSTVNLPTLRVQYKEYSVEHRKTLSSDRYDVLTNFWSSKLAGLESLYLATDRPRPSQFDYLGNDVQLLIDPEMTEKLKDLAKSEGTSLYTVMISAYCFLLNIYTNQHDISIGVPVAHRTHPEFESVIGFFVNLLPLRVNVSQPTVHEFIGAVQKELVDAQIHQDMPFQDIIKLLHVEHDSSRHPLVQTVFNWETEASGNGKDTQQPLFQDYSPSSPVPSVAKFDLNATVKETRKSLSVNFNYSTSLFDEKTIQGFLTTYQHLLQQMVSNSTGSSLAQLSVTKTAIGEYRPESPISEPTSPGSRDSLSEMFEHQAAVASDRIALTDGKRSITYHDLNVQANQLAWWMMTCEKIQADDRIALMLDKSIETIVAILAVWKVGAAYVPLDPGYPEQRVRFILQDTSARMILTSSKYLANVKPMSGVHSIAIDAHDISSGLRSQSADNLALSVQRPSNLAYVIFTSGTTGKPKGVLVEQKSVTRLRDALVERYFGNSNGSHAVLFLSNYIFDFSVEQLVLSILSGNKLVIPPEEGLTHESFYQIANTEELSYISGTPSVLQQVQLCRLQHLRMITAAGEEFHSSQYENMRAQFKGPINNAYGITETTVYNLVTTFGPEDPFTKALRDELPGSHVYVLNDRLQRVPINAIGELYLSGDCVTRGYLNQEALTSERFIANPFCTHGETGLGQNERLYKTGDLVCYRGPHQLEYLGRSDQQVKLRGFRIELSEVTDALFSIVGIKEAAVIPRYEGNNSASKTITGLIGYYTLDDGISLTTSEINESLSECIPSFMIPDQLRCLEASLPVTVNGKLDTNKLTAIEDHQHTERYCAPRNSLEVKLCQLWASLLGMDHCGIDDDLFALGGDSISSLRLVGDIYRQLGCKVTVKDVFLHRTVRALHDNILAHDKDHTLLPPLRADQSLVEGDAPLLPIQEWFLSKPLDRRGYWNHCFTIRTPALDAKTLQNAVENLQKRHDVLRMRIRKQENSHDQTFPEDCASVDVQELNVADFKDQEDMMKVLSDSQSEFDIERGPMFTVVYLHGYQDGSARIWFSLHHLIVDTVSWNIILSDLQTLYRGGDVGMKSSSVQQWALAVSQYSMPSAERSYWDSLREKTSQSIQSLPPCTGSMIWREEKLSKEETTSLLQQCCARLGVGMHDILLMAVGSALQSLTGNAPTVVTVEGHGREESIDPSLDVSRTVGWFTSMYPFEIPQVEDLIQGVVDVKSSVRQIPNNGVGYGASYGYTQGSMPEVSVNYLGRLDQTQSRQGDWTLAIGEDELPHGLVTSPEDTGKSSSSVDVTFSVADGQLSIQISSLWGSSTTQEMLGNIQTILSKLAETVCKPDFQPPPSMEVEDEYTPYFAFEGGARQGRPLFLLPPGEGGAESYFNNIVHGLPRRNLVVFNNHYRHGKSLSTFEELSDYYLSLIRSIQPEGPYDVLGWSFGGILALEIAQRLTNNGERIGTMALIDPYFDIPSASKAIGETEGRILDPIYHVYHPEPAKFKAVETHTDRVMLFKASQTNDRHGNNLQRKLYEWYAACPLNNLDTYVTREAIQVVPMKGTHFTWVHDAEQVRSMCALLDEFAK